MQGKLTDYYLHKRSCDVSVLSRDGESSATVVRDLMMESVRGLAKKTLRCQINAGACGLRREFGYKYQQLDRGIFPEIAIFFS